jgi:hypothetical protein
MAIGPTHIRAKVATLEERLDVAKIAETDRFRIDLVDRWGQLPTLSLVVATALLLIALSYAGSRWELPGSIQLWWLGQLLLFLPAMARLLSSNSSRDERLGIVILIGIASFLVKVLYDPIEFRFVDELQQLRSAENAILAGHLFTYNPILPVSPLYPGMHNVTIALASVTGLPIFYCSLILMAATRLVFSITLFVLYERISGSPFIAGVGSALYMTNPHFQFLASYFIYQSIAIPLAVLALWLLALRSSSTNTSDRSELSISVVLLIAAVTVTHHISSYAMVAFLLLWQVASVRWDILLIVIEWYAGNISFLHLLKTLRDQMKWHWGNLHSRVNPSNNLNGSWTIAILATVMVASWTVYAATITVDYLSLPLSRVFAELFSLIAREADFKDVFRAPGGPLYEQMLSAASVVTILACLPVGVLEIWRRHRGNFLATTMAIGSIGYVGTILLRLFSTDGAPLSARTLSFLFLCLAFTLAVGVAKLCRGNSKSRYLPAIISAVLFLGGLTSGWPPSWARLPGGYLAGAFERSVNSQGVAAAKWARDALGFNNRFATDFTNYHLLGSYGMQHPDFSLPTVFLSQVMGPAEWAQLRSYQIRYLAIDLRYTTQVPLRGYYFVPWEPNAFRYKKPIDARALTKFDQLNTLSRLFDSGDIVMYRIEEFADEP